MLKIGEFIMGEAAQRANAHMLFMAQCSEEFEKMGEYNWAGACALEVSDLRKENKQHKDSRQIDLTSRVNIIKVAVDKMAESKTITGSQQEGNS
jgi:hypothetical protein